MVAFMLVATAVAAVYVALIALHVLAIRNGPPGGDRYRPRVATWLATADERRRDRTESEAVRQLMSGSLDRASYRAAMSIIAADEAIEHPFTIPTL